MGVRGVVRRGLRRRAALIAELYGPRHYGRIAGMLAFVNSLARGAAPVGESLVYNAGKVTLGSRHGYDAMLAILAALCLGSAVAILGATHEPTGVRVN